MTTNSTPTESPASQYIRPVILDWNIIHYWISEKMRNSILPVLRELNEAKLQFTMSEISIYEAQCQLPVGKDTESLQFMDGIPRYPIDTNTHKIAGVIMSCYRDHEKTKGHARDISLQDVFNASCAILNNGLVVTADYNDYPAPFFDQVWRWNITNESGRILKIHLLAPDVRAFDDHTVKWVKSAEAKKRNEAKQNKHKADVV